MNPLFPTALPLTDGCWLIDNSSLEKIITCPRAAEYYIFKKRESSKDRSALKFGKIVHRILEHRYRAPNTTSLDQQTSMIAVADEEFAKYTPPEDEFRNYAMAVDVIKGYNQTYPSDLQVVKDKDGAPLVEIPFLLPLGEITINASVPVKDMKTGVIEVRWLGSVKIIWTGKIDLVVSMNNSTYGMDHKTTSIMGPSFFREFDLSSQFVGYTWALRELLNLTSAQLPGFIINAIAVRKPTRTGEKLTFSRYTTFITDEQVLEWKKDVLEHLSTFLSFLLNSYFPKATKWCVGKYGECEFFNVCLLPEKQRALMLSTGDYKSVTWSPLDPNAD